VISLSRASATSSDAAENQKGFRIFERGRGNCESKLFVAKLCCELTPSAGNPNSQGQKCDLLARISPVPSPVKIASRDTRLGQKSAGSPLLLSRLSKSYTGSASVLVDVL
jgi:hypothetical protein